MKIWKCDMCGKVLEKDTDVFVVSCGEPRAIDDKAACEVGIKSMTCYTEYELCSRCARKVDKFIRKELTLEFYPALKTIYNYCKWKNNCDDCLLNEEQSGGQFKCMVGLPEDNWAKFYPDLKKGSDPE